MRWLLSLLALLPLQAQPINQIMQLGQSLCGGTLGTPALTTTQPYSNLSFNGSSFVALVNSTVENPGVQMANTFTKLSSSTVIADNNECLGGTDYDGLKKGTTPYNNGLTLLTNAASAAAGLGRTYTILATMTTHGENNMFTSAYAADLIQWQSDTETDFKAITGQSQAIPMFVDQVSTWNTFSGREWPTNLVDGTFPGAAINQWVVARDHPTKFYMVGPKYQLPYAAGDSTGLHLSNIGYRILGGYHAKAMKKVLIDHGVWTGCVPRHLTLSGTTITAQFWVPAGSLSFDTTTVTDKGASKGFEFWDDSGSPPTVSSATITASDTITIVLSGTPTGGNKRLRYAFTGIPVALGGTANAAHGNVRDTDTTTNDAGDNLYDWLITFDEALPFAWDPAPIVGSAASGITFSGITLK